MFLVFFCNSVTLRGWRAVRSRATYFEQVLRRCLWVDFDTDYTIFSTLIALSNALGSRIHISVARWRHNFREIAFKNFDKSKNRRKSLCARLSIDS